MAPPARRRRLRTQNPGVAAETLYGFRGLDLVSEFIVWFFLIYDRDDLLVNAVTALFPGTFDRFATN